MAAMTSTWATLCVLALTMACERPANPAASVARFNDSPLGSGGSEVRRKAEFDRLVDVGGLKLHIQCEGVGAPLVVFDSGLGQGAEAWDRVWPSVAAFTRTCVYDRANHGQSDRAGVPHSNRQMARELYALLTNSAQPGPYVLVGHSMGGTNVQLFLEEYASSVAGMVLLDASPEPPPFDRVPPAAMAGFERNIARLEGLNLPTMLAGFEELRVSKRTLGDKPLAILVAGRAVDDPNFDAAEAQRQLIARQQSQRTLLRLSSNSVLFLESDSAHHIPNEAHDTVIRAVQAVVHSARTGGTLSESSIR